MKLENFGGKRLHDYALETKSNDFNKKGISSSNKQFFDVSRLGFPNSISSSSNPFFRLFLRPSLHQDNDELDDENGDENSENRSRKPLSKAEQRSVGTLVGWIIWGMKYYPVV